MIFLQSSSEHASDISTVLGDSLVIFGSFVILLFLLQKFAFKPVMEMIEKRQLAIESQMDRAKALEESAQNSEQQAKQIVEQAHEKAQQLIVKAKETSEKLTEEALQQSRQEAIRIREEAQLAMSREREVMLSELTAQVSGLSVDLAKRILKREITESDHQRLINDFIEGLDV